MTALAVHDGPIFAFTMVRNSHLNGNVDNTPAPESPVSLCVLRGCPRASSGATAGWTTGPPYQASRVAEAKLHPRHSGITAGELDEFVEGP